MHPHIRVNDTETVEAEIEHSHWNLEICPSVAEYVSTYFTRMLISPAYLAHLLACGAS